MATFLLIFAICLAAGWLTLSMIICFEEVVTTATHDADSRSRGWELHRPHPHVPHMHVPKVRMHHSA